MKRLIILAVFLTGCTWFKPDTEYVPTYVPIICNEGEVPQPLNMLNVEWQLAIDEEGKYVLGLDGRNYSNLSINIAEIKSYILNQQALINYYKQCIKRHNEKGPQ